MAGFGENGPGVAACDADLGATWTFSPAGDAPQVVRAADAWVVASSDGEVVRLDDAGTAVSTRWHPGFADLPVDDMRLSVSGNDLLFLAYGLGSYPIGGGHVNTYNFVEISTAPIP